MSLPGARGASAFAASSSGASALGPSALGASALGASALGASALGASALGASALGASPCPGARSGDSIVSDAEAAFGSLEASEEGGTAGPAPREPVSPLLGSACCSLTSILQ